MVELIEVKTTDAKNFVIAAPYAKSRTNAAYRVADDKQTLEVAIISGKSTNSLYQIPGDWEDGDAINGVCAGLIENSIRNDFSGVLKLIPSFGTRSRWSLNGEALLVWTLKSL